MKLLIVTQKVDKDDPVLGFFHGWLEEFSKYASLITVVCLEEGEYSLPNNVSVLSLGKEKKRSRIQYIIRFYAYIWSRKTDYDAVFIHMNEIYSILGAPLWFILGKRIVLWRNHKIGTVVTRIAGGVAHVVLHTSLDAYVAGYNNAVQMPMGIDTRRFIRREDAPNNSVLFLGRLDPVKNCEIFMQAVDRLAHNQVSITADVYGGPSEGHEEYAQYLKETYGNKSSMRFFSSVPNYDTPAVYAAHGVYVNLTPSGSFDKTIGEAMASGCVVVASNKAVKKVLGSELYVASSDPVDVAHAIERALSLAPDERRRIVETQRAYIEQEHSLALLTERLFGIFSQQ